MHYLVPLPGVLVEVWRIPEILVKLTVLKARKLGVEIGGNVENDVEAKEVNSHGRQVEGCINLNLIRSFHWINYGNPLVLMHDVDSHESSN